MIVGQNFHNLLGTDRAFLNLCYRSQCHRKHNHSSNNHNKTWMCWRVYWMDVIYISNCFKCWRFRTFYSTYSYIFLVVFRYLLQANIISFLLIFLYVVILVYIYLESTLQLWILWISNQNRMQRKGKHGFIFGHNRSGCNLRSFPWSCVFEWIATHKNVQWFWSPSILSMQ